MGGANNRSLISAHFCITAYFLTAETYKRMRLTTRVYGSVRYIFALYRLHATAKRRGFCTLVLYCKCNGVHVPHDFLSRDKLCVFTFLSLTTFLCITYMTFLYMCRSALNQIMLIGMSSNVMHC